MARNKVQICGVDTSKLPMLKHKEMRLIFESYQGGDFSSRKELIQCNLRLVLSVVQRFSKRAESLDDLFQIGCIGLIKAIDNFDLSQNVRFSTYAVPMIIGEIRRYLRDNNPVRVSRSLREIAFKALRARDFLSHKYSREPSIQEISNHIEMTSQEVVFALDAIQEPVSLFEPVFEDSGEPILLLDQICEQTEKEENWANNIAISESFKRLNPRERKILSMRFFEGKTQMEIASEVGISQAQVSRVEKNAISIVNKFID